MHLLGLFMAAGTEAHAFETASPSSTERERGHVHFRVSGLSAANARSFIGDE